MGNILGTNGEKLREAARAGRQEEVDRLIGAGASVDSQDKVYGYTALMMASCSGYGSIVESLIRAGATVDMQDKVYGYTALIMASCNRHGSIVESLIRAGASVDIQDKKGCTTLLWASRNGHGSIVDSLIRAGASVDMQDKVYGWTALIWASCNGHGSIVDSLLQHYRFIYYSGVDPNPPRRLLSPAAGTESLINESLISLVSTSRALCVTTLLADNFVYMNVDSTEELVHMLFTEYNDSNLSTT